MRHPSETHLKLKSRSLVCPYLLSYLSNRLKFCTKHDRDCCALYKMSKWLDNRNRCLGRTRFREIWVSDEFRPDILHCTRLQSDNTAKVYICRSTLGIFVMLTCHELPYTSIYKRIAFNETYWEVDKHGQSWQAIFRSVFCCQWYSCSSCIRIYFSGCPIDMVSQYCAIKDVPPNPIFNSNLVKSRSSKLSVLIFKSFWFLSQSTTIWLPCCMKKFGTNG